MEGCRGEPVIAPQQKWLTTLIISTIKFLFFSIRADIFSSRVSSATSLKT